MARIPTELRIINTIYVQLSNYIRPGNKSLFLALCNRVLFYSHILSRMSRGQQILKMASFLAQ